MSEVIVQQEPRKRGRPKNPFRVPDASDTAKQMMAKSLIYRILVKGFLLKPEEMDAVPVAFVLLDSTRGSEQTGEQGSIKLMVPDHVVKNLRGDERLRDLLVLVRIPRDVHDEIAKDDPMVDAMNEEDENGPVE